MAVRRCLAGPSRQAPSCGIHPTRRWAAGALATLLLSSALGACSSPTPTRSTTSRPTPTRSVPTPSTPSSSTATTSTPSSAPKPVVVGLGDSVMSGAACGCRPFIDLYGAALGRRQHTTATVRNLGRSGLTVPGLTTQVAAPATAETLRSATVVVVTIGANDLVPLVARWQDDDCDTSCISTATRRLHDPLDVVLRRIRSDAPGALLLVTDYWNVFEDGDVADGDYGEGFAAWSDAVTAAANTRICAAADTVGATCVDLFRPFNGSGHKDPTPLLADDGDHPNAAGHAAIARVLLAATPTRSP